MAIDTRAKVGLVLVTMFLLLGSVGTGCSPGPSFDEEVGAATGPYQFSLARWELDAFGNGVRKAITRQPQSPAASAPEVTEYFAAVQRIKELQSEMEAIKAGNSQVDLAPVEAELGKLQQQNAAATSSVERLLEEQVKETLSQQGIFNPIDQYVRLNFVFPPVDFRLGKPPHLLVISPRDRIESLRTVALLPDLSLEQMTSIEEKVDKLGVSSLVVELGGLGTYPSYVTDGGDLPFTLETVAHEWVHQYLTFKPLGFLYLLDLTGIRRNYDIATIDETLTSMVSKEIGAITYESNYTRKETGSPGPEQVASGFDFNQEMREIRKAVDDYLARGEIEQAETFMEQKRQFLATKGYHIRKLNQAYFAFYGTYADSPTSISPIGAELKKLRSQSASLNDFLETVAAMTSRQDLAESVK